MLAVIPFFPRIIFRIPLPGGLPLEQLEIHGFGILVALGFLLGKHLSAIRRGDEHLMPLLSNGLSIVGIIHGFSAVGSYIKDIQFQFIQIANNAIFQLDPSMIGTDDQTNGSGFRVGILGGITGVGTAHVVLLVLG